MLLSKMRSGFMSAIFIGLLVAGAFGLVLADWNGFFRGGNNATDVAKVDGVPIKIITFNNQVSKILRAQKIDPAIAYETGVIDNILQAEILRIILKKTATDYGIRVDDQHIAAQVRDIIAGFKDEKGTEKDALNRFLQMQGMTEKQLVEILRDETTISIVKSTIGTASHLPQGFLNGLSAFKNETRDIEFAFIPNDNFKIKNSPDEKTLTAYYETIKGKYMLPETRNITVAVLNTEKVLKPVTINDADIKTRYEEDINKYQVGETRTMEQVIVKTEDDANKIIAEVKTGKKLIDVIGKDNKNYSSPKDYQKNDLPEDVSKPLFAANKGDTLTPIKTALGWHVIHLQNINAPYTKPLNAVSEQIKTELQNEKNGDALYEITSQIEDRLAAGEKYEDLAKDFDLKLTTIKDVKKDSKDLKDLEFTGANANAIIGKAFTSTMNEATTLTEVAPHMLYSLRVDDIKPAAPKEFALVKDDVKKMWSDEQKAADNLDAAQQLAADINNGKAKLEKPQHLIGIGRDIEKSDKIALDVIPRFMDADKDKVIVAQSNAKQGVYLARVTAININNSANDDAFKKQLIDDAINTNLGLFLNALQKQYPVEINHNLLERTYRKNNESE